jgi:hypothetical protein
VSLWARAADGNDIGRKIDIGVQKKVGRHIEQVKDMCKHSRVASPFTITCVLWTHEVSEVH